MFIASIMAIVLEKGKPAARRGRKATGLPEGRQPGYPKGDAVVRTQTSHAGKRSPNGASPFDDHLRRISVALFAAGMLAVLLVANTGLARLAHPIEWVGLNWLVVAAGFFVVGILLFPWHRYDRNFFLSATLGGMCLIALAVYFSGGWQSPFFPLYFFVVVFSAIYYSARVAAVVVLLTALASLSPQLYDPHAIHLAEHVVVRLPSYLALALVSGYMAREIGRREAEERYRTLVERIPAVTFVDRAEGSEESLYVSPQIEGMLGYTPEEWMEGKLWRERLHPEDRERILASDERFDADGEPVDQEYRLLAKDGSVVWVREETVLVRGEGGEPLHVQGILSDVTEKKLAEEALRKSQAGLAEAQRLAHLGSWEWDLRTSELYWSDETFRIYGFEPQSFVPTFSKLLEVVHPDDRQTLGRALDGALYEDRPCDFEHRVVKPDSEVRVVHRQAKVLRDEGGEPIRMVGTVHDITERKEAEERLREAEERYRTLVERIPAVTYVDPVDDPDNSLYTSPQIEGMLGYTPEEWRTQKLWPKRLHPDDRDRILAADERFEQGNDDSFAEEYRLLAKDGSVVWVREEAVLVSDAEGKPLYWQGFIYDLTGRKEVEETLRLRDRAISATSDGIVITDAESPDEPIVYVNAGFERITGYGAEEVLGRNCRFLQGSDRAQPVLRGLQKAMREGRGFRGVLRNYRKDGTLFFNELQVTPVRDEDGRLVNFVGVQTDVTPRIRAEQALKESEQRYRTVVEEQTELVCRFSPDLILTFANEAYCRYFGQSCQELVGESFLDHIPAEDRYHYEEPSFNLRGEKPTRMVEHRVLTQHGGVRWMQWTDTAIFDAEGHIVEYQSVGRDVTERRNAEERLEHQALHDPLTGLPNRRLFVDRLGQVLRRTRREVNLVAVLFMDLDDFKVVNDSLGHEMGDRLLVAVAERLQGCLRPDDTLARFGGDEFVVLLEDAENPGDSVRVAERIIDGLGGPLEIEGRGLYVRASIGIALGEGSKTDAEDLLRDADTAMYRAKEEGSGYALFDPAMYERVIDRLQSENDLKRAIECEEFVVHYQPIVDLRTGEVCAVEALVRWEHPERGLLNPDEFVPIAEESGLVIPMGERVLREACLRARGWQEQHPRTPPLVVSVNLSAGQLSRPGLAETVQAILQETGLEGSSLTLDVTETVYVKTLEVNTTVLDRLRSLGVRISIDDFGMGYSSLSYLKRLPADALKIDKSFVKGLWEDAEDTAIIRMIIELAHTLGMEVIAEGVETAKQAALLEEMGCDFGQGFHFSKPLPPEDLFEHLIRASKAPLKGA